MFLLHTTASDPQLQQAAVAPLSLVFYSRMLSLTCELEHSFFGEWRLGIQSCIAMSAILTITALPAQSLEGLPM